MVDRNPCFTDFYAPGMTIDDRYHLTDFIGAGGMACVFKAYERDNPHAYALKFLKPEYHQQSLLIEFFQREADNMVNLAHPGIVRLYRFVAREQYSYIVMDYIDGYSLSDILKRLQKRQQHMPLDEVIRIMVQVGRALEAIHRENFVHRDIKPGNVLISREPGSQGKTYLSDLGITVSSEMAVAGAGTLAYMAPEHYVGGPVDARADIYACGIMLYEMFARQRPFLPVRTGSVREAEESLIRQHVQVRPPDLTTLRPDLPAALNPIMQRVLAKNPAERYQSVLEFVRAVHEVLRPQLSASLQDFNTITYERLASAGSSAAGPTAVVVYSGGRAWLWAGLLLIVVSLAALVFISTRPAAIVTVTVTPTAAAVIATAATATPTLTPIPATGATPPRALPVVVSPVPTLSATPTPAPTLTMTTTMTHTATATATVTATVTATMTHTVTPSPTRTTATVTSTVTVTPTPSPVLTLTTSPALTATATQMVTVTTSPRGAGAATEAATATVTPAGYVLLEGPAALVDPAVLAGDVLPAGAWQPLRLGNVRAFRLTWQALPQGPLEAYGVAFRVQTDTMYTLLSILPGQNTWQVDEINGTDRRRLAEGPLPGPVPRLTLTLLDDVLTLELAGPPARVTLPPAPPGRVALLVSGAAGSGLQLRALRLELIGADAAAAQRASPTPADRSSPAARLAQAVAGLLATRDSLNLTINCPAYIPAFDALSAFLPAADATAALARQVRREGEGIYNRCLSESPAAPLSFQTGVQDYNTWETALLAIAAQLPPAGD